MKKLWIIKIKEEVTVTCSAWSAFEGTASNLEIYIKNTNVIEHFVKWKWINIMIKKNKKIQSLWCYNSKENGNVLKGNNECSYKRKQLLLKKILQQ